MQNNIAQTVCFCSLMAALAVLLQSAPVFLPVAGMLLSPLSSLPMALAAIKSKQYGVVSLAAAALILLIIWPQESAIFVFSTGLMGLLLGMQNAKKMWLSIITTSLALFAGINVLAYVFNISVFGDLTPRSASWVSILVILLFSIPYAIAWAWIVRYAVAFLIKVRLLKPSRI